MSEHITYVTDETFEPEVLQSPTPVLVDYWAEWCGPCKMIAPILDEVAKEYSGRLKIAKLNIDENQATPPRYGIRGIPTLICICPSLKNLHVGELVEMAVKNEIDGANRMRKQDLIFALLKNQARKGETITAEARWRCCPTDSASCARPTPRTSPAPTTST
jgi:thioredoxin 1